jgi:hypothetical protein
LWAVLAGASVGCLPVPHMQQEAPAIRGVALRNGEPLARARVRLVVNPEGGQAGCDGGVETRTDPEGTFAFAASSYFSPILLFGDRRDSWRLCFHLPAGGEAAWDGSDWWGGPPEQRLTCEMGKSLPGAPPAKLPTVADPAADRPGCRVTAHRAR